MKNYSKEYALKNPHMASFRVAIRRAKKRLATPLWANKLDIKFIYKLAKIADAVHGIKHEVDHIFPLISKVVCGLHVYENLQVLPRLANKQKSNKFNDEYNNFEITEV